MNTIYIIIEENGYDGFECPHNDEFYLTEQEAEADCESLNKAMHGDDKKYYRFFVQDLTLKK